ncbi:MAG: hypothetical protein ABSA18_09185 [Dehalococcoidia bacterium]|jgi:hypothetical protein
MSYSENNVRLILSLCEGRTAARAVKFLDQLVTGGSSGGYDSVKRLAETFSIKFNEIDWKELQNDFPDAKTVRKWIKEKPELQTSNKDEALATPTQKAAGLPTSSPSSSNLKLPALPPAEKSQPVSQQLINDIKKLVTDIKKLTEVPIPETRFYPDNAELKAADTAAKQGDNMPFLSVIGRLQTPKWWYPRQSTRIRAYLDHESVAVLDRFLELTSDQTLRSLIEEWESAAETYRKRKESNVESGDIRQAYLEAIKAKNKLDAALAKAHVALY